MNGRNGMLVIAAFAVCCATNPVVATVRQDVSYDSLAADETINGFRTAAVYVNDDELPMGAQFVHERSGFTLDLMEIQSVPQAMICVTTFPTSDMGEPHTQEHLLLGKGNKGRALASLEPMALAGSTAFTMQWRTCYSFNTTAGADVFFDQFETRMDAFLHPDYTDEEIQREVRNFGIRQVAGDGRLALEEKGTVYNEMVSSMDQPGRRVFYAAAEMIYGPDHPLAFDAGGSPEGLRVIQPSDIRTFHAAHYHLANIGAIVSVPGNMPLDRVLERFDESLGRLEPENPNRQVLTEDALPAPRPASPGEIRYVDYPHENAEQPGAVQFTWPADRDLDLEERTVLSLFLQALAGDPTTNLYKRLIDSRTREADFGAQSVFAFVSADQGNPITVGFNDIPAARMNDVDISDLRARVLDELRRVASWQTGSSELQEFNQRIRSRVVERRRDLAKLVNSPPQFGLRGRGTGWITHLYSLGTTDGFRRSLTMKPVLEAVEDVLANDTNVWAQYLNGWGLIDTEPWALAAKPNTQLTALEQRAREARVAEELEHLMEVYGTDDGQEALRFYQSDYDADTEAIEVMARQVEPPRFVDDPPLTLDDQLDYELSTIDEDVPFLFTTFDSMTSATAGIALRADVVSEDRLLYLSILPALLTEVGVIEEGTAVSYEEMSERLRQEILGLDAYYSSTPRTGRVELVIRGSGNDRAEAERAIDWMRLVLFSPDWRPRNLPRIRDVVDQVLAGLRRTMQRPEEAWVQGVAAAYWKQDNPVLLAAESFMTRLHNVHRLRWMLKDGSLAERREAAAVLEELAEVPGSRAELEARLVELRTERGLLLADAAEDLALALADVPDSSLEADWAHLCQEMSRDLGLDPDTVLAELGAVRRSVLNVNTARLFLVSSKPNRDLLLPEIENLIGGLDAAAVRGVDYSNARHVVERLRERDSEATDPVYVGLINPNSQSGVFMNTASFVGYEERERNRLLDYLSVNLYGGGGGHSIFMKTIGAGLAYSNGIGGRLASGRVSYYAERTPLLPQTLQFVIGELEDVEFDPSLVDYAVAQAFRSSRSALPYEARTEQMARDFADGLTPDTVAGFRKAILDLRDTPDLATELYTRMNNGYALVLPGMELEAGEVEDPVYFVIGPEAQFTAWENYLKSVEGPETKLYRLYPRDFWR